MHTISKCEVCDGADLQSVLDLGNLPLCDDLVPVGNPARTKKYPVELLGCAACLTIHQKYQVDKSVLFPRTYHYRAGMTEDVLAGMRELVSLSKRLHGELAGAIVLDIGCNDGSLLEMFKSSGARTIGIEPTGAADEARARVDHVINGFFDCNSIDEYLSRFPKPDIITFTNVFAHISDLQATIKGLLRLAKKETIIIIENHYLGSVVSRHQFDTFYHEHPRTYSYRSFEYIARKLAMQIWHVDFPRRYNGNIRVAIGRPSTALPTPAVDESALLDSFPKLRVYIAEFRDKMMTHLRDLARVHGPLPAKAFPGRAAVIIGYYGVDETLINAAYERSASPKVGHYIPGTRIPICDEVALFADLNAPVIVNLAWHIRDEIHRYMRNQGYTGNLLDIFS